VSETAIRVEGLGKRYRMSTERESGLLKSAFQNAALAPLRALRRLTASAAVAREATRQPAVDYLWALREISFEISRGEVVGIMGHNGAGKSVLLKILSRITDPTTGYAAVYGTVGSLLEVGTGFHPDLSGRENVFLNGAILGMQRREIQRKFDEIVEFSGLERFIDNAVKHYSSGMAVRLAFSVAVHLDADIIFLDEVWTAGDQDFQRKAERKMHDLIGGGRTVVIVSHALAQLSSLCQRSLVLDHGRLALDGPTAEAVQFYTHADARIENLPPQGAKDASAEAATEAET